MFSKKSTEEAILGGASQNCFQKGTIMGIFDSIESAAESFSGGGDHAAVANGLLQELGGTSGIGGLIQQFQQNGMGDLVEKFASGQGGAIDPNTIEQAIGNSGIIDKIASSTGMSADTVKSSLGTVVPALISHVTTNGHFTTDGQATDNPAPDSGSLVQSLLGKLL
jgi:uncharacterized protein YidB (DUF937 family)